jgi:hypothetical protein
MEQFVLSGAQDEHIHQLTQQMQQQMIQTLILQYHQLLVDIQHGILPTTEIWY